MGLDPNYLLTNSELRKDSLEALRGNWGTPIGLCFVIYTIMSLSSAFAGGIVSLIIGGPLVLGITMFFLQFRRQQNPTFNTGFDGFKHFGPALGLYLLQGLFVLLWTLLLVIPGIIKSLSYSQSFFIMVDEPEISPLDAISKSRRMMRGAKGKLFLMYLNFFLLSLLCILTLGIGYLWLIPFINNTMAGFYEDLKKNYVEDDFSATATGSTGAY